MRNLVRRVFDLVTSLFLILLTLPVQIAIAVLIKSQSSGPILFKQQRLGRNELIFTIWKFRTMCVGSDPDKSCESNWTDERVTPVGRLLRSVGLDEVPQLYNVLRGDMSMVGPRPHIPSEAERFSEAYAWYSNRFKVKPGIGGPAYKFYENKKQEVERICLAENDYVDAEWSAYSDIKILIGIFFWLFGELRRGVVCYWKNSATQLV